VAKRTSQNRCITLFPFFITGALMLAVATTASPNSPKPGTQVFCYPFRGRRPATHNLYRVRDAPTSDQFRVHCLVTSRPFEAALQFSAGWRDVAAPLSVR
jgi:hypothetical protein